MPFRDRKQPEPESDEKSIEINAEMNGTLCFKEPVNLKINGQYSGTLDVCGMLTIGGKANVEAHIKGDNIIIAGRVTGNIVATKMLVLMPTATLNGDVTAPKLNIVEGAVFNGRCQMEADDFLNLEDLAQYLELEKPTIMELVTTGKIPAIKDGEAWKFEKEKIDDWASSGKV